MSPSTIDAKIEEFKAVANKGSRMGVSEFSRSKLWRKTLTEIGCFEVVERGEVVGYMLAPEFASAISDRLTSLEEQLEQLQISAMFSSRVEYAAVSSGEELVSAVDDVLDARLDSLMGIAHGD